MHRRRAGGGRSQVDGEPTNAARSGDGRLELVPGERFPPEAVRGAARVERRGDFDGA